MDAAHSGRPHVARRLATLAAQVGGQLLPMWGHVLPGTSSASVTTAGSWGKPNSSVPSIDRGTRWAFTLDDHGTLAITFTARSERTFVATALAGDGDIVERTTTGVLVAHPDGTSVRYAFAVAGRRTPLGRARRLLGGSAYDAQVRGLELRLHARRGERVVLRVTAAGSPPAAGG